MVTQSLVKKHLNNSSRCLTKSRQPLSSNKQFDWQALVETANVAILIFDSSDRICYVNSLAETIVGYTKAELRNNTDLLPQLRLDKRAISQKEICFLTKNGNRCWLNCSIKTIEFDRQPSTLVTAVDVTSYKLTQEQIQQDLERKKKQADSHLEFISMVSHELRTPLNIISFSSELLQQYSDRWGKHRKQKYLNRIQRGIKTIALLIDEVSIIGKAEAQIIKFEPQKISIQKFCQTLLEDLQLADCNERQINFSREGNLSAFLDKNILQLILTNLLENAVKYSPQGQPVDFTVTTSLKRIDFTIKDRGIGITQSDLQKLFEPFYRGSNVGQLPGTGLGLAVVKKLVDLHGGQITVNNQVEVGTEFIVSLPI